MKRANRTRHRPGEVVAKLRRADEALARVRRSPRWLGVSEATLHRRRAGYGRRTGMQCVG